MHTIRPYQDGAYRDLAPATPPPPPRFGGPLTRASALAAGPDAFDLLRALRRRLGLAVGSGLALAALAGGVAYRMVANPDYTARAVLRIARVRPAVLGPLTEDGQDDFRVYLRTQEAWIKSPLVLKAAVNDPKVAGLASVKGQADPLEWLKEGIKVQYDESEILLISLSGSSPSEPVEVVNAVVRAYQDRVLEKERKALLDRLNLLKEIQARYQKNLEDKRKALAILSERAGSDDRETLALLQQYSATRLLDAERELASVHNELRRAEVQLEVRKADGVATPPGPDFEGYLEHSIDEDRTAAQLAERAARAQSVFDNARRLVRPGRSDPSLKASQDALAAARSALAAYRERLRPVVRERLRRELLGGGAAGQAGLEERVSMLRKLRDVLKQDVATLTDRERAFKQTAVAIVAIQDEIENADAAAKQVGAKVEQITVELEAKPRVELIQNAERPNLKDELRKVKLSGASAAGAFAFALLGIAFWEFRERKVQTAEEVTSKLGLRIMGALPIVTPRVFRAGPSERKQRHSLLLDSVDATRAALLHASRVHSLQTLMVTSARGGEGKTTLSCHLATSLARAGRRTLLIDADLRKPSIHRLLDVPPTPGLCAVLRGEVCAAEAVRPTATPNLWLIPAGCCDEEAARGLTRDDLRAVFEDLKKVFDFVVIDTSPVLPVAEALLIGQNVDAVIFSILRDVSRLPAVRAAYERLNALGVRPLGAVVTGADVELYGVDRYYPEPSKA